MFDESVIEVATGQLIRLPELSSRLTVGEKGTVSTRFDLTLLLYSILTNV